MSIIEPSTVDEDVRLSEPCCSEEACTSHQNKSESGEVNVLSEHSSANTKSVKQTRKTKSSGRKKGQRKKSKRKKQTEDIADKQDLCGICSKSEKEDEDWICCDLCSIWYENVLDWRIKNGLWSQMQQHCIHVQCVFQVG